MKILECVFCLEGLGFRAWGFKIWGSEVQGSCWCKPARNLVQPPVNGKQSTKDPLSRFTWIWREGDFWICASGLRVCRRCVGLLGGRGTISSCTPPHLQGGV